VSDEPQPAPPPVAQPQYLQSIVDAMVALLQQTTTPALVEAQEIMARRLALQGDVVPSRIPVPQNITQVGGWLNLLDGQPELRAQVLASALGVAGPAPALGLETAGPVLFFATQVNDRPATTQALQAVTPVNLTIRSDFLAAFTAARITLHDLGCQLPALSPVRALPPVGTPPPDDLLAYVGRTLDLVPSAALVDPDVDPLAIASLDGAQDALVARQFDAAAPRAAEVLADDWTAWTCTASECTASSAQRLYVPLAPILNAAGWYQGPLAPPVSLGEPGGWPRWTNITGLVAGTSTLGAELQLLYPTTAIVASSLRDQLDWRWDGTTFTSP
jgi:hypothetical protein